MNANVILIDHTQETYSKIEIYRSINQELKKLTKDESEIKSQLAQGYFANHKEFIYQGRILLTYEDRSRTGIDMEKLKKEYPEAFSACQKQTEYKQFCLK
jgi:predicted phage-related endonuclease